MGCICRTSAATPAAWRCHRRAGDDNARRRRPRSALESRDCRRTPRCRLRRYCPRGEIGPARAGCGEVVWGRNADGVHADIRVRGDLSGPVAETASTPGTSSAPDGSCCARSARPPSRAASPLIGRSSGCRSSPRYRLPPDHHAAPLCVLRRVGERLVLRLLLGVVPAVEEVGPANRLRLTTSNRRSPFAR